MDENTFVVETKTTVKDVKSVNENVIVKKGDTEITDEKAPIGTGYSVIIADKTYAVVKLGDVNGDGALSPSDYVKVKNHIMKVSTLEGAYLLGADISGDGSITPSDYVKIKNAIMAN